MTPQQPNLIGEDDLTGEYLASVRRAQTREALVAELGEAEYERRERERAWNARVDAESAALRPGGVEMVTLSDGTPMEVREPLAMAWMRALGRVVRVLDPLMEIWKLTQNAGFKQMDQSEQAACVLQQLSLGTLGGEGFEQMTRDLFAALDALLGKEDGWTETHARPADLAALTLALIRVCRLEDLKFFFGQARAAAAAQWRTCQRRAS